MSADLITNLQQNLSLPSLYKTAPATRKYYDAAGKPVQPDRFAQSVIPATLIAMYAYSRTDEGALAILQAGPGNNWVRYLFTDKKEAITRRIAAYSGHSLAGIGDWVNRIATEIARLVRETADDIPAVKQALSSLQNEAKTYLPPDLQLEELLAVGSQAAGENEQGLMQAISASFAGTDTDAQPTN